jgi:hypothetical protein
MKALVVPTDIPGLYNLHVEDGRELTDITIGQLKFLQQSGLDLLMPGLTTTESADFRP